MKKLITVMMVMAMLMANVFTVSADAASVSALMEALPEAAAITESTEALRDQIEDITETIITDGLTEADFESAVWAKWQKVKEKNAYYLPTYDTIDISSAAQSVVFANSGETLTDNTDFRMNYTTWGSYYAYKKDAMTEIIGSDELMYSETGVPFSFPKDYRKAIGQDSQSLVMSHLQLDTPKSYRSLAIAATAIGADTDGIIRVTYTDGSIEDQKFTVPGSYNKHGNLAAASSKYNFLHCYTNPSVGVSTLSGSTAIIGMSWFEFPVDINRTIKRISFIDEADPDGTNDYTPRDHNFRILAVTGCTDISQAEKDAREAGGKIYETVNIDSFANSIAYADSSNLDKSTMTLTSLDFFDWSQTGAKNFFAAYKDNMVEVAGDDELIYNREGVPYSFPKESYNAIAVKKGVADSVAVNIGKKAREIKFLTATGQYSGHGTAAGTLRIKYADGTYTDEAFKAIDSWGYASSDKENMVIAPRVVYGDPVMATDGSPAANRIGFYEVSVTTDFDKRIETIEFKSVDNTSNYKIMAVTAEVFTARKFKTVDLSYPSNSVVFADDNPKPKSKTVLGKTDYFDYADLDKYIVISKSSINELAGNDEIIYGSDGVPFSFPKENYRSIGLLRGETNAVYAEVPQNKYTKLHFITGSADTVASNKCYIDLMYTDNTTETVNFACAPGWGSAVGIGSIAASPEVFYGQDKLVNDGKKFKLFAVNVLADSEKTLKGVRFGVTADGAKYKVLALTAEYESEMETFDGAEKHIDISSLADSLVTVNAENGLDRKNMSLNDNDYFMYRNYKNCLAVDEAETAEYVGTDGIVIDKSGISYETDMKKAITLLSNEKIINTESVYAGDIAFIAASGSGADGKLEITFEDGTVKTEDFKVTQGYKATDANRLQSDWLCEIKKYISFNALQAYAYYEAMPTMGFYSIHIENNDLKKISSIKFIGTGAEYKILAVTLKNYDIKHFKRNTENAIGALVQSGNTSIENAAAYDNIDNMLEVLEDHGVNLNSVSGIEEYKAMEAGREKEYTLYMSPNGSDGAGGETASEPLATLDGLKARINELRKKFSPHYPVRVILAKGEYKDKFVFSGEWGTENSPIIFDGSNGAVFTGSSEIDISAATAITDTDMLERIPRKVQDNVIEIDLAAQGIDTGSLNAKQLDLFLDGKRQNIAQYPNGTENYAYSSGVVTSGQKGSFTSKDENIGNWGKVKDNEAYLGGYFAQEYRCDNSLMAAVDTETKTLTLTENTTYGVGSNSCFRWKAYHVAEELDEPGEWYINQETGMLYYYPPKDLNGHTLETVTSANIMIQLVDTDYITFKNIHFKNSAGTALYADRNLTDSISSSHITVDGCTFTGLNNGISISMGVDPSSYSRTFTGGDHITIKNNTFLSIGGWAIRFYGGDTKNLRPNYSVISNNYIYSTGEKDRTAYAVNLDYSIGTVMRNNIIHRMPAAALSYTAYDADVLYNEIYDTLRENEDGGALYSGHTFVTRGNEIAFNYIHDGLSENARLHNTSNTGIYLDDGLSGQEVHHNIVESFGCGILLSGVDNKIYDNTIINSAALSILAKNSESAMASDSMRNAVVQLHDSANWETWLKHYPELEEIYADSSECKRNVFTGNLIDRSMYLTAPFTETGKNTITNNMIYGFRINSVFDENGLADEEKGAQYIAKNTNLLTNGNFDINTIGLDDVSAVNTEVYKEFELVYPKNGTYMDNPSNQLFIWETALGADEYVIEISETADFASIVYTKRVTANRTEVSDFNFADKNYYWRVRAENISHMIGKSWMCESTFKIVRQGAYQLETVQKQFNISPYFNANAMIKENEPTTASTANRLYDPYTMNETFFAKYLDKDGNVNLGGTVFKVDLSGDKKAVNSYSTSVTMDIENDEYSSVDFLIFGNVGSTGIQLLYDDGSTENRTLNFNTDCIGRMYVQGIDLSTGIVNDFDCVIRAVRIITNNTKTLDKIKLIGTGTTLNKSVHLFAVTGHKEKTTVSENGKTVSLYTQNASGDPKSFDIYEVIYDESGKLESVTKAAENFAGNEIKTSYVYVPENKILHRFIWNDKLMPESAEWLSE